MRPGEELMRERLSEINFKQWCKLMDEHLAISERRKSIMEQLGEETRLQDHVMSRIKKFWDLVDRTTTSSVSTSQSGAKDGVYTPLTAASSVSNIEAAVQMLHQANKNKGRGGGQ